MVESIRNDAGVIVGQIYNGESEEYLTTKEALRGGYELDDDDNKIKTEDNYPGAEVIVKKRKVETISDEDNIRIANEIVRELRLEKVGINPKIVRVKTGAKVILGGKEWFLQKSFNALRLDVSLIDDPHAKKYRYYSVENISRSNFYKNDSTSEKDLLPGKRFSVNTCFLRKPSLDALNLQIKLPI
ncbi:MAG: hypothetical protein Q8P53_01960 [Candidatus Shapirobacteria bacterium]|nr:hypothetical protein [Candidatus Shapirobacteria bacterium]